MQILFCAGGSGKNRLALARGFFWMAVKALRSGNVTLEIENHQGARASIIEGGAGVAVIVRNDEEIYLEKQPCISPRKAPN
ncbi:MAG: hypothetical protein P0Y63_24970 [Klebsiella huaxiensis]|uniref:hypothetical protein n=1 Tax=Klebsiella huaxiensis TaxID=2153354 RepID=UPI0026EC1074|nr:hypothetical protein [Klebsiella huaxiensis]WEJ88496.1 MAG: hypothetical protein P0Y63_24970 [Klebsiella huaxiensis]